MFVFEMKRFALLSSSWVSVFKLILTWLWSFRYIPILSKVGKPDRARNKHWSGRAVMRIWGDTSSWQYQCSSYNDMPFSPFSFIFNEDRNVTTLMARLLAAKLHSTDVEHLISTSAMLKSITSNRIWVESENEYQYIYHNMPSLTEWHPRASVFLWMIEEATEPKT